MTHRAYTIVKAELELTIEILECMKDSIPKQWEDVLKTRVKTARNELKLAEDIVNADEGVRRG